MSGTALFVAHKSPQNRFIGSMWSCVIEPKFKINLVCHATFTAMRSEIQQAVQLLLRGDDAVLEQALALLQNTVFSFY